MRPLPPRSLLLLGVLLTACAGEAPQQEAIGPSSDARIYDYTQFDYTYARAIALQSTNLEPAPTSYILFPAPLDAAARQRVEAYCRVHYEQFKDLGDVYEADPFGNIVTFYWPVVAGNEEVRQALGTEDAEERCAFLEKHYDYRRAKALLETLEGGTYLANKGPVLVLDLGFDAVVVAFDNVETEKIGRIPPIWKQAIDDALSKATLSRKELLARLEALDAEIAALEATTEAPGDRRSRRQAEESLAEKRQRRRGLWRRIFGKDSWGRAVLCGFSGTLLQTAGGMIPSTEPLKVKLDKWCGPQEPAGSG